MNDILLFKFITLGLFLFAGFRYIYAGRKGVKEKSTRPIPPSFFFPSQMFKGNYAVFLGKLYIAIGFILIALGFFVVFYIFS